jgi:hypothetical protein
MLEWVIGLNTYLRGTLDEKIVCKFLIKKSTILFRSLFFLQLLLIVIHLKVKNILHEKRFFNYSRVVFSKYVTIDAHLKKTSLFCFSASW